MLLSVLLNVCVWGIEHLNHIQTPKAFSENKNYVSNSIFSHTTESSNYSQFADSVLFLRRLGTIRCHGSGKNAREIAKLIPRNPDFLSTQTVAAKAAWWSKRYSVELFYKCFCAKFHHATSELSVAEIVSLAFTLYPRSPLTTRRIYKNFCDR